MTPADRLTGRLRAVAEPGLAVQKRIEFDWS